MIELNDRPHSIHSFTNRHGLKLFARLNGDHPGRPLALVAHGLSDVHDSPHMRAITSAFINAGYNVLTWDATHSWGRSGGSSDRATLSAMTLDLEDVAGWAEKQSWFHKPFVLVGHSMGAAAALRFAVDHPAEVDRLILTAPVVAGSLLAKRLNPIIRTIWWMAGRLPEPGHKGKKWYRYDLLHDGLRYDGRVLIKRLTCPVSLIAAENDILMPPADIQQLFDAAPQPKQLHIIPDADHFFAGRLDPLEKAIVETIKST